MSIAAACALLAMAAEPQCPTDPTSCDNALRPTLTKETMCNTTTWMIDDYCDKACPMRLVITDPPELRTWMCAMDNKFEPYSPDAHIDLYHRLNNKVLDLEAVGDPNIGNTRRGCATSDFAVANKSFTNKIALMRRGTCGWTTKARNTNAAGAAMLFVVDYWPYYTWRSMTGSSAGIEKFPAMFAARHEADYVLAALDKGVKVKGMFQYQCNDMPEGYLDNPQDYPWDKCGTSRMALDDKCTNLEDGMEPLCEICTVELQLPGAEKLCLFGNNLRPRTKETLMHTSWQMPYVAQNDEVVYATELANRGCSVSDYAGLAGKILLVPETGRCTLVQTVRSAQEAGVKAYILITSTYYLQWYRIRAYSHHVHIPVHTVDYHTTPKLQEFIKTRGRHIPGSGWGLDAITFSEGAPPPTDPPTPAPLPDIVVDNRPKLDTSADFEMTGGNIVCIVIAVLDLVVIVAIFLKQRSEAVQLPAEVRVTYFSIPLGLASMGLSLTLLLLIAIVTFSLATVAGQDSTDKAIDNGKAALDLSYESSAKSTVDLSDTIRNNIIDRVLGSLRKEILTMEYRLKVVEDMFFGFDGSWAQFDARVLTLWRMMRNADASYEDVGFQVFTTNGFFVNVHYKTDDRIDSLRPDNTVGNVSQTNEGWRYGVNYYSQEYVTRQFKYGWTNVPYQYNASRQLAGNIGDPIALTRPRATSHTTWMSGKLTFPLKSTRYSTPMAAFRPLYGGEGQYHGTVEVHNDLDQFIDAALDTSSLSSGNLRNMSVLIVDNTDKSILGSYNTGTGASQQEAMVFLESLSGIYGSYFMHEHPTVRVNALANYLDKVGGWTEHQGLMDQKDHFTVQPYLTLAKITTASGQVADTGVHNWDVELQGGGVVYDDQLKKDVLHFDGMTTLQIYRNLSRRAPIVAKSQVSAPGQPYKNRYEIFNEVMNTKPDGSEQCVSRAWYSTPTTSVTQCMLRPDISKLSSYMVSLRIRPDVAYTETAPSSTTPRLFSDSLVGDANIRLFANGQLYLFVLRYGCRTKAYEGGFPVGAWTTVTASVGGGYCRLYVNGTLYDYARDKRSNTRTHGNPYRSGQFFQGRMDNIQLFRYRMSGKEVATLHTEDKLVRDVQSKQYFVQTKTLDMNEALREGVKWSVAVSIPRADIMRVVDANKAQTLTDVQIQEENTNKELRQKSNATIVIIVAIAMSSVLVFLIFNNILTKPFEQTAFIMAEAAVLRVDSIPEGTSRITELGAMNVAMRLMLENLKLYKSFMPQSVQLDTETDADSESAPEQSSIKGSSTAKSHSKPRSTSRSVSSVSTFRQAATQKAVLSCSLTKKKFSFLVANVCQWHEKTSGKGEKEILGLHAQILDGLIQLFTSAKGVAEVFSGDRFACSFNAAKPAGHHRGSVCASAKQCCHQVSELGLQMSVSCVTGEGRVGNVGTASMRRFSFLSPMISWAYALERFGRSNNMQVVIDHLLQAEVGFAYVTRLFDAVIFAKYKSKQIRVFELLASKEAAETDEWMYELQQGENNDPMKLWNDAALKIVANNYEFEDEPAVAKAMNEAEGKWTSRIVSAYRRKSFEPFQIILH